MIVYTVQTEEAWKQFKKLGYLEGNKEFIDPDDVYSYDWMVRVAKQDCLITKVTILFGSGKQIITQIEIIKLGVEQIQNGNFNTRCTERMGTMELF